MDRRHATGRPAGRVPDCLRGLGRRAPGPRRIEVLFHLVRVDRQVTRARHDVPATETTTESEIAAARIAVYQFLLAMLDKPTAEQFRWLRGDECRDTLSR